MINSLTSLRFFFALAVFLSHYRIDGEVVFSSGYLGVSFFFILSGFILSYAYKNRLSLGQTSKTDFYVARFARIYPLHLLIFLFSLFLAVFIHQIPDVKVATTNLFLLQSWIPDAQYYFSLNAPSWSLSCEMFFYALFPSLLFLCARRERRIIFLLLFLSAYFGLLYLFGETKYGEWIFYINPIVRTSDFMVGILLYFLWEKYASRAKFVTRASATALEIFSIALLSLMICVSSQVDEVYTYACCWVPMSCIIYVFAIQQRGVISRILSHRRLVLAGEVSFGFYMFHLPVIEVMGRLQVKLVPFLPWELSPVIWLLLVFLVTFALSFLSFKYLEKPMNRTIKRFYERYKIG